MNWSVNNKCPCGGTYEDRRVEVRLTPSSTGVRMSLDEIPQGACPSCGSRVYQVSVLQRIETAFKS